MADDSRQSEETWDWDDVARYLKVSRSTVRNRMRDDDLPFRRIGGVIRFVPGEVREWFHRQPTV